MSQDTELGLAMFLVERGILSSEQLQKALDLRQSAGDAFETILVANGFVTNDQLASAHAALGRGRTDLIAGYEIIEKIGQGGMGAVYRARQLSLDRIVAIKVLLPKIAQDRGAVERFLGEVKAIAHLSHPHLVSGIDAGYQHGLYYCVMEYVEGKTLKKVMNISSPLPWKEAIRISRQIGSALKHAHGQNIIHRDVKPENILIAKDGNAKLMDLGLARLESVPLDAPHLTQEGQLAGTPMYMSPEQAMGKTDIDHRSDIYSLGLTLFEMLCGHQPFDGSSQMLILAARVNSDPRYALLNEAPMPDSVVGLVRKMTAREKEKRCQTMDEVLAEIDAVLAKEKPSVRTTTRQIVRRTTQTRIAPPGTWRPKTSAAPAIVLVLLVVFGGIGLFALLVSSSPAPRPRPAAKKDPDPVPAPPTPEPKERPAPSPTPAVDETWKAILRIADDLQSSEVVLLRYFDYRDRLKGSSRADDLEQMMADLKKKIETGVKEDREKLQSKIDALLDGSRFDEASGELSAASRRYTVKELQKLSDMPEYAGWMPAVRAMESKVRERVSATVLPMCERIQELCKQGKVPEAGKVYEKIRALGAESIVREVTRDTVKVLREHETRAERDALEAKNDEWNIERGWKAARDLALEKDIDGAVRKLHETRAGVKSAAQRTSIEELCRDMEQVRDASRTKGASGKIKFLLALCQWDDAAAAKELASLKGLRAEYLELYERVRSRAEEVRGLLRDADRKYGDPKTRDEAVQIYADLLEHHAAALPEATLKLVKQRAAK